MHDAFRDAAPVAWAERDRGSAAPYLAGGYGGLRVALARPTRMGGRSVAPVTTTLVTTLRPRCLAMPGVSAGNPRAAQDFLPLDLPSYGRPLRFAVHTGPTASGNTVIEDPAIWQRLRGRGARGILALEMEAATVATVAHQHRVPHWLVAKGVMDHADPGRGDGGKGFAARASAEVLWALATSLPAREPAGA